MSDVERVPKSMRFLGNTCSTVDPYEPRRMFQYSAVVVITIVFIVQQNSLL